MNKRPLVSVLGISLMAFIVSAAEMTHTDKGLIGNTRETRSKALSSFCLDLNDNLIACDRDENCLRVISPDDKLISRWDLDFSPQVAVCRTDGTLVVAGSGRVAILDSNGKTVFANNLPVPPMPVIKGKSQSKAEITQRIRRMTEATSIGAMGDDIFVCTRANTGFTVYRITSKLERTIPVITGLNGCCGQMDITAKDGKVYLAANCESKIVMYDRDGKKTGSFGKDKDNKDSYFNGCCEPKNVCVGPDGSLYVSESAQCCINRFSADGKLLDRVGIVKGITGCVRVTVAVNRDASLVYMLDTDKHMIRVLARNTKP
ncbi:MAG: hypothetical protein WCS52_16325 [bacterium]